MRTIAAKFVLLLAVAAIMPLLAYSAISLYTLRVATRQSVTEGNLNVATRSAEQIQLYVANDIKILRSVAENVDQTDLAAWQKERIVRNFALKFPDFQELTLFDAAGSPIASSRIGAPRIQPLEGQPVAEGAADDAPAGAQPRVSPMYLGDDGLPTMTITVPIYRLDRVDGWLAGQINLLEMWRLVDSIRIGSHGFALVVGADDVLIAHGDPDEKARVARRESFADHPLVSGARGPNPAARPRSLLYRDQRGQDVLGVAASIPLLNWTVIVEQPTAEAYAAATTLGRQLWMAIALVLVLMSLAGYLGGRTFIRPVGELIRGTHALSAGRLDERVHVTTRDEFRTLGDAFNGMADKLVQLQEDVRKSERQAMFGRIAVGLVHDLSHPLQNIGNSCQLILRMFDDREYRETFKRTVDREFASIKRVLDDLRNVARPTPVERFPMDLNRPLLEVVDSVRGEADRNGISLVADVSPPPLQISGDVFALERVYRNLITNALQATPSGGSVTVRTARADRHVEVSIADTGCGIPYDRLTKIFDDFVTTKRRGLGLGLAITRKIVEQLDGTIAVTSEVGRGTTFTLRFPALGIDQPDTPADGGSRPDRETAPGRPNEETTHVA